MVACACGAAALLFVDFVRAQDAVGPTPPPPLPAAIFNAAVTAFDRGDYQGALTAIDSLLRLIPADLTPAEKVKIDALLEPIYFTRGAAHFNLNEYPQAITALKDYLARYPKNTRANEVAFSMAQANFLNKDFAAAAQAFAALESVPNYRPQALLSEGLSYRELNDDAKAVTALEKLVSGGIKSPLAARGGMQLIYLYGRLKQPDKALKMLSDVQANIDQLENVVELNTVAFEQGDSYLQNNANKEALICYRAVRTREQVIALEHARIAGLQKRLEANQVAARANPREASKYFLANRQLQTSIAEDQKLVDGFEKLPTIYPKVLFRIGRAFSQMGKSWEANVAFRDAYERSDDADDRESALYAVITTFVDVNQPAAARTICNDYLKEYPAGTNRFTVGYLLGATALQENDPKAAESYFGRMIAEQPASSLREEMSFLLANALLAQGKYDEAKAKYSSYQHDYPKGTHFQEAVYREDLAVLFGGNYDDALKRLEDFLKKYPANDFTSDAKYRRDVCKYAQNRYEEVIADTRAWLQEYRDNPQQGEVQALLGDALVATDKPDEALAAYQISYKTATTDEVLNYSLMEAGKILQKRGAWAADAAMFEEFVREHPDHPTVVIALAQIGRAKTKEGKVDEAKHFLAEALTKYIGDRNRNSVEQILDQLAMLCVRKKPRVEAAPSPGSTPTVVADATPAPDPGAELDELLGASLADRSPTAQARILYAKSQLARLRRQPAEADHNLATIATTFKPAVLSATILGAVGDALLAKGKLDEAAPFYRELMDNFPKDDNVDFAYAGLAEIAFQKKKYAKALELFRDGMDKIAANQKTKDLTVGQAKSLLALGKLEDAKKIFEQAASVKEWRGETTAYCVYSLAEIEAKQGHWDQANVYYQRVFVAYRRFLPWVAKAYLGSANALEKLGKKEDAVKVYQEMLGDPKLTDFAETTEARHRLQALGAS